jgi:hypothetical protein
MAKHVSELYEFIRSNTDEDQKENWCEVEKRVKTQLPLRIVSCVQIASKLLSHYKVIFNKETNIMAFVFLLLFRPTHSIFRFFWGGDFELNHKIIFFYRQSRPTRLEDFLTPLDVVIL